METLIRVRPDELKMDLFTMLQNLTSGENNLEIIIQVKEKSNLPLVKENPSGYLSQLNESVDDRLSGRTVSFTMEEFETYVKENFVQ